MFGLGCAGEDRVSERSTSQALLRFRALLPERLSPRPAPPGVSMRSAEPHVLRGARRLGEVGSACAGSESSGGSGRGGFSRTASCRFALGSVASVLRMRLAKPHGLRRARRLGEVGLMRAGSESVGGSCLGGFSRTASRRFALGCVASVLRMRSTKPHGLGGARRLGEVGVARAAS